MALFLVTSVCDEGVSARRFRVVEAESRLAITNDMLADPVKWEWAVPDGAVVGFDVLPVQVRAAAGLDAAELSARIDRTWVDGDSLYQVRIHEIETVADLGVVVKANTLGEVLA